MSLEDRHARLGELFEATAARPPSERETFLREREDVSEELAREVLELLAYDQLPGGAIPGIGDDASIDAVLERLASHSPAPDRYAPRSEVGRGGMGSVLDVWDQDLRRHLAMKVMLANGTGSGSQRAVRRFVEEAQITGQLEHPGIVPVHELGIDSSGRVYFTMQLVRGRDLGRVFELGRSESEGWNLTRVLGVLLRACEAVAYAHSRGVIHRDLKPSNVMVGNYGEVYVMDWGLARVLDSEPEPDHEAPAIEPVHTLREDGDTPGSPVYTREGDVAGTPSYMSPEQGLGRLASLGPQSDVYSLGAMLYELLSGRRPYTHPTRKTPPHAALVALRAGPPEPLEGVTPGLPPELVAICERAMAREPNDRYADVGELVNDLRAYLEHRVVRAYRTGPVVELQKWVRRNRPMAGALAALVAAVVAMGFLVAWYQRAERRKADRRLEQYALASLLEEAPHLWPATAAELESAEQWVREALSTTGDEAQWRSELEAFEAKHSAADRVSIDPPDVSTPEGFVLSNLRDRAAFFVERIEELGASEVTSPQDRDAIEIYELELRLLGDEVDRLEREAARRRGWRYKKDALEKRYSELQFTLAAIEDIARPESGWTDRIRARIDSAREHLPPRWDSTWAEAIESIASNCPVYGGLVIQPQEGLVPLGRNPATGLHEFWHTASGERPVSGEPGHWDVGPDTGIVLVLIPGGDFHLGLQVDDPGAPNYCDRGVHTVLQDVAEGLFFTIAVHVEPFFISRYELTQGQWHRVSGEFSSSTYYAGSQPARHPVLSRTHPAEGMSWLAAYEAMADWNLTLPTEAQWARAARGGGSGVFGWVDEAAALRGFVNFKDTTAAELGWTPEETRAADGWTVHAPVDSFAPNPYGLHHVLGNVQEWCLDWFTTPNCYPDTKTHPETGQLLPDTSTKKSIRGGALNARPSELRIAFRFGKDLDAQSYVTGVRPARPLRTP